MSITTAIEWCDATFNPWIGCTKVSPACDHCYAAVSTPARSLRIEWGASKSRHRTAASTWETPLHWERKHQQFAQTYGRRRRVFCASLADVFDNEVPDKWRADLFALIAATPNLDWLLLTKRIGNVPKMLVETHMAYARETGRHWNGVLNDCWDDLPGNVWLGATVVHQEEADRDIPKLLAVPARVRFLSIEPMLGPIDLMRARSSMTQAAGAAAMDALRERSAWLGIDWVICGGESGPKARPMHPDWARSLRDQCASAGMPFLFKQWGAWEPIQYINASNGRPALCLTPSKREVVMGGRKEGTQAINMRHVGKAAAGRLLDGVEHNGFPA